jgi:hypothetical protein
MQLLEKMSSGTSERFQVKDLNERIGSLEGQISEMETNNNSLRGEINKTNSSVGQYMREMNNLIDCHELSSVSNMEVDQDSDDENNGNLVNRHPMSQAPGSDLETANDRKHAGTGGSSKMKARPTGQQ